MEFDRSILEKLKTIEALNAEKNTVVQDLLTTIKDKNIDLDTRWNLYTLLVKNEYHRKISVCGDGYVDDVAVDGEELIPYDDFYVERYETLSYISMCDRIVNTSSESVDQARLPAWKERVLQSGETHFKYDW